MIEFYHYVNQHYNLLLCFSSFLISLIVIYEIAKENFVKIKWPQTKTDIQFIVTGLLFTSIILSLSGEIGIFINIFYIIVKVITDLAEKYGNQK